MFQRREKKCMIKFEIQFENKNRISILLLFLIISVSFLTNKKLLQLKNMLTICIKKKSYHGKYD